MTYRKKAATARLSASEHRLLCEALRRHTRFYGDASGGQSIIQHWTGLGSAHEYKSVFRAGMMKIATEPNPGHMTWWKLTSMGARIVAYWIGLGFDYRCIENSSLPSAEIPTTVL